MKKILLSIICTAIITILSSCSTPPPPDTIFNLSSSDPYRQGQNLVEAIAHGANSAAYRLMERGAPLNYQDKKDEWTPLIYAIYHHNWRMAKVLIRAGANVNLADSANRTPLMWAALRNSGVTATLLVEYGANLNAVDINGRTALQYAIIYCNYTLAAYLADAGRKPPILRLKKEQFDLLENKRKKAKAVAENLKLYGKKNEEKIRATMKKEDINKNVKKDKEAIPKKIEPVKKAVAPKIEAVKITPPKEEKPVKITDILNADSSEKELSSTESEPKEYVTPMRLLMPKKTKKPSNTSIIVLPKDPSAPKNPYIPTPSAGPR